MASSPAVHALVLGAGNFGTCLAQHLASVGHAVKLWSRHASVAEAISTTHKNPRYLSQITLNDRIQGVHTLDEATWCAASVVVVAIPTQGIRSVLETCAPLVRAATDAPSSEVAVECGPCLVLACKGIEKTTLRLPLGIVEDVLGKPHAQRAVVLSGPSFAVEVATGQPTAVSAAGHDIHTLHTVQRVFHAPHFRVYTRDDPVGLEVSGALKNIIAIGAGACAGLGFQRNTAAALITRGLAEITRLGVALGADPLTFNGLGGVGDLFLTCSSEKSRNFTVGARLGRGDTLEFIIETLGSVAEGVATAKAAHALAGRLGVELPITAEVYRVLYEDKPIDQAVKDLLHRAPSQEIVLPATPVEQGGLGV